MSVPSRIWATSRDGEIDIVSLSADTLAGGLDVMRKAFFLNENVCKAVGVATDPAAIEELIGLCIAVAKDGVSVVAVEKKSGKVVAASFNKIFERETNEPPFYEAFARDCKRSATKAVLRFMMDVDGMVDLFEVSKTDCLMELMFVGTLPEFRRRGLSNLLAGSCTELGRCLTRGENVKVGTDDDDVSLPLHPVPKALTAIFTTFITQKMGRRQGFTKCMEISFDEFECDGTRYSAVIGSESPTATLEYKVL